MSDCSDSTQASRYTLFLLLCWSGGILLLAGFAGCQHAPKNNSIASVSDNSISGNEFANKLANQKVASSQVYLPSQSFPSQPFASRKSKADSVEESSSGSSIDFANENENVETVFNKDDSSSRKIKLASGSTENAGGDGASETLSSSTSTRKDPYFSEPKNRSSAGRLDFMTPDPQDMPGDDQGSLGPEKIGLDLVIQTVFDHYPEINIALGKIEEVSGKFVATQGAFDRMFTGFGNSKPVGFYENHRMEARLGQPLFGGGEIYGLYRIGDGFFEPWYGERETNEGGELKAGFSLPIIKDNNIDARRAKLFEADLEINRVQSSIDSRILQVRRMATQAYWEWVASGVVIRIQKRLLQLALDRVDNIDLRVEKGDLPDIAKVDNQRFITKREVDLIKARRLLEKTAIKLSVFWRDQTGSPMIAREEQLPLKFPDSFRIDENRLNQDITQALQVRPELNVLNAERQKAFVDLEYANNLTLPKLDFKGFAAKDLGTPASKKGDKTPFELQVGLVAAVPLQRREGFGKIQAAQGKLAQIASKLQLTRDKIKIEVQDAASAVNAAHDQIVQSTKNVELNMQALRLGKIAFEKGDIDLIALNIYETSVATAELQLLDAQLKFFIYLAIYENAIRANAMDFTESLDLP